MIRKEELWCGSAEEILAELVKMEGVEPLVGHSLGDQLKKEGLKRIFYKRQSSNEVRIYEQVVDIRNKEKEYEAT